MTLKQYLQTYLSHRPFFLSLIRAKEAELFFRYMPLAHPVLDVGCGDGFFAQVVFEKKYAIDVGLDVEDSRQSHARGRAVYKKLVTYDGKKFPFATGTYQTVISNCVLEHIPNLAGVVAEMYRVLAPGGSSVVSVMAHPWEEHLVGNLVLGNTYKQWMRKKQVHFNLYRHTDWSKVFTKAGFRIEQKIGYLSPRACRLIDAGHYISLPSLITYLLLGRWMLLPGLVRLYPLSWLARVIGPDVSVQSAGALFFVLRKPR